MSEVKPKTTSSRRSRRLLTLDQAAIRLRDRIVVADLNWELHHGEHWALLGANGAGKTSLARALTGELAVVRGRILRHSHQAAISRIKHISFENHQHLIVRELERDVAREFSGRRDDFTRVRDLLALPEDEQRAIEGRQANDSKIDSSLAPDLDHAMETLGIDHLRNRGLHQLSTGELRKVMIARILFSDPGLLILDEPFDGLDPQSRSIIGTLLKQVMDQGIPTVLITHRHDELLPGITHVLVLEQGQVKFQGPLADLPRQVFAAHGPAVPLSTSIKRNLRTVHAPVIQMEGVTVGFEDRTILLNLDWTVRPQEHWAVVGPNGAGKSTLMALIAADHPQAYANRIHLFGRRRGSGESIWEIKQRIGMVSFEQQVRYQQPVTARQVILSGFFDSIGLYRQATDTQKDQADHWIQVLALDTLATRPFTQLSHGERRLVLLARAMVKAPQLLILDEPCQGLDVSNRHRVLALVDRMAADTQLIFVTHHPRELPEAITHILQLPEPGSGNRARIQPTPESV